MFKTILLGVLLVSAAQADIITIDLLAAFGQGVTTSGSPTIDFRDQGLKGPRSSTMTIAGSTLADGVYPYSYSGAGDPSASHVGLNIIFDTLARDSFTSGATNTWSFATPATASSFTIWGNVSDFAGAPAGYNALFTGTMEALGLSQPGGGVSTISLTGPVTLNLTATAAGLQFIQALSPLNTTVSSSTLTSLSVVPNAAVGGTGSFVSTGTNFLSGQVVLVTATPEPASFMTIGLAGLAFGLLRLRRKS